MYISSHAQTWFWRFVTWTAEPNCTTRIWILLISQFSMYSDKTTEEAPSFVTVIPCFPYALPWSWYPIKTIGGRKRLRLLPWKCGQAADKGFENRLHHWKLNPISVAKSTINSNAQRMVWLKARTPFGFVVIKPPWPLGLHLPFAFTLCLQLNSLDSRNTANPGSVSLREGYWFRWQSADDGRRKRNGLIVDFKHSKVTTTTR